MDKIANKIANEVMDKIAKSTLPQAVKNKIGIALGKAGLDGNYPFSTLGKGLNKISEVLSGFGIEHEVFANLMGDEGNARFDIAFTNPDDAFSPEDISNAMLVVGWYKHGTGRYEVTAYIS
jgi:hypothetical protein